MNVRVEYDPTPIRHIAVQCPNCKRWFHGYDATNDEIRFDYQIRYARFECPVCEAFFCGYDHCEITEFGSAEEVYKGCLEKKVSWE